MLAFALIGLIIYITPVYMRWLRGGEAPLPIAVERGPKQQVRDAAVARRAVRPEEPDRLPYSERPAPSDTVATAKVQERPTLPGFQAQEVVVETDRYTVVFSTRGGCLTSFVLRGFRDYRGQPLELVPANGYGLGLSLDGASQDSLQFRPSMERPLQLAGGEQGEIVFSAQIQGRSFIKRFRFQGDRYRIDLGLQVGGVHRGSRIGVSWQGGLSATQADARVDAAHARIVTYVGGEVEKWDVDDLGSDVPYPSGAVSWVGVKSKYFMAALIPPEGRSDLALEGTQTEEGFKEYSVEILVSTESDRASYGFGLLVGPISYDILRGENLDLEGRSRELALDEFMDYGWAFLRPIMKPTTILILRAFLSLREIIPNYGFVIITFSVLVKIVLFPLTHKSLEASAKMQKLQPQIAALREKYSSDQQKLNKETMKLYKEQKVNPLGGCLPLFFQMPILFSLFNVFRGSIELRQAGFGLWITDLSQPDRLLIGGLEIHVLPLLMAASMFIQQKMTMKDPKQAAMVYIMPLMMTFFFWSMSSGLVLYWTMFNLLTIVQQQVMEHTKSVLGTE